MPILSGSVKDENGFSLQISEYFTSPQVAWTEAQYNASNSAAIKAEYPLSAYGNNPSLAQIRIGSDGQYGGGQCTFLRMFKRMAATNTFPLYTYIFTYERAPSYFPQMPNVSDPTGYLQPLAYHTADIQFVFPGYHGGQLGVNLDQLTGKPREIQGQEVTSVQSNRCRMDKICQDRQSERVRQCAVARVHDELAEVPQAGYPALDHERGGLPGRRSL